MNYLLALATTSTSSTLFLLIYLRLFATFYIHHACASRAASTHILVGRRTATAGRPKSAAVPLLLAHHLGVFALLPTAFFAKRNNRKSHTYTYTPGIRDNPITILPIHTLVDRLLGFAARHDRLVLDLTLEARQIRVQPTDVFVHQFVRLDGQLHLIVAVLLGQIEVFLYGLEHIAALLLGHRRTIREECGHELAALLVDALHQRLGPRVKVAHQFEVALQLGGQMLQACSHIQRNPERWGKINENHPKSELRRTYHLNSAPNIEQKSFSRYFQVRSPAEIGWGRGPRVMCYGVLPITGQQVALYFYDM